MILPSDWFCFSSGFAERQRSESINHRLCRCDQDSFSFKKNTSNVIMMLVRQPYQITKEVAIMDDKNTLAHTSCRCKYHIVFAPKYRRKEIYGKYRVEIGKMIRILCQRKGINIVEAELCPDHIHMLVEIPPKYSVSQIAGYLKGKSSLMIFDKFANLKYRYGNRHFWCR